LEISVVHPLKGHEHQHAYVGRRFSLPDLKWRRQATIRDHLFRHGSAIDCIITSRALFQDYLVAKLKTMTGFASFRVCQTQHAEVLSTDAGTSRWSLLKRYLILYKQSMV
jgi:hypothetical protein